MYNKIPGIDITLSQVKTASANVQVPLNVTVFCKTESGPIGEVTTVGSYNEAVSLFGLGQERTPVLYGIQQVLRSYGHVNIVRLADDNAEYGTFTILLADSDSAPYDPEVEIISGKTDYKTDIYNGDEIKLAYDKNRNRLSIKGLLNGVSYSTPLEIIDLSTAKAPEVSLVLDKLVSVWNTLNTGVTLTNLFTDKITSDTSIGVTDICVGTIELGDSGLLGTIADKDVIDLFELLEGPKVTKQDIVIAPEFRSAAVVNAGLDIKNKYFYIVASAGDTLEAKQSAIVDYNKSDQGVCYIPSICKFYNSEIEVPFECAVVYAWANSYVDSRYKAPAGTNRASIPLISDIEDNLVDSAAEKLYNGEIPANPVKYVSGFGYTLYGQKTMDPDQDFTNRINVSSLTNYIKEESTRILSPYLFEYTPVQTFQQVYIDLSKLFDSLVNQNVIYGDYQIICDESNNTPETLANHELHASVAVRPLSVTEYIYLDLTVTDELGGNE